MNLYTIVTADEYELPVLCDVRVKQAAQFLNTTTGNIRQLVFHNRKRLGYRVIIAGKVSLDRKEYQKRYRMTHDRSEQYREYYRRRRDEQSKQSQKRI